MTLHPKLSLNAIVTPSWTFEQDLDFWTEMRLHHVGLFIRKLDQFGHERAVEALKNRGLSVSSIICGFFSLDRPEKWEEERATFNRCIDVAAEVGGIVYGPPGRGEFDCWQANVEAYSHALAPCLNYGRERGVTIAFEPSLRPQMSFVHSLRDSLDLAEISGAAVVVDIGNCYQERDVRSWIRQVGSQIAVVQVSDVMIGTVEQPGPGVRDLPGRGDLPLLKFVEAAIEAGYAGPFEVELMGSPDVDRDALKHALSHMSSILDAAWPVNGRLSEDQLWSQ